MKKTLIALAALAVAGTAFAQSSVTLSGVVGFGFQSSPGSTAGTSATSTNAGVVTAASAASTGAAGKGFTNTDATIAVAAVEDLGGGLKANFAMAFDNTGTTFASALNRRNVSLGLSGEFGAVAIANTRSSDLLVSAMVAPSYLPDGMYDTSGVVNRAAVDVFEFKAPSFNGFTPYVQRVETATDGNTSAAYKVNVIGVSYANGPLAGAIAYKSTTGLPTGALKGNTEAFVTYDMGVAKLGFGYDSKQNAAADQLVTTANAAKSATSFGIAVPVGAMTVGANFAKRGDAKVTEFAAKYDLSKRTSVRFSSGKQTVDANSQNRLALVHTF